MNKSPLYIQDCGIITSIGRGKTEVARALFSGSLEGITMNDSLIPGISIPIGAVKNDLPELPAHLSNLDCRNNRLMQVALSEIELTVREAIEQYGADRIAVVVGTSTSDIASGEAAYASYIKKGKWPENFNYNQQELSALSTFVSRFFDITGPSYTVATACSSSAKFFASARRLIQAGFADAAIIGGTDTLCRMTLNGFNALELLSKERCNPFSVNRTGITIGEGASAFLMGKNPGMIQLLGIGETSDAYHMTAPDPTGKGAQDAMRLALKDAQIKPEAISYINLHGTASILNDAMEAVAIHALFGNKTSCSSTKGMTGHILGRVNEIGILPIRLFEPNECSCKVEEAYISCSCFIKP